MALAWLSKQWATFRQWLGRTEVPVQLEVVQLGNETRKKTGTRMFWGRGSQRSFKLNICNIQNFFGSKKSTFSCGLNEMGPTPFSGSKLSNFLRFF